MRKGYVTLLALVLALPGCRYYGDFWKNDKASGKNTNPFTVTSVLPANGATNVATNSSITLTFNRPIDIYTATAQATPGPCTNSIQISTDNYGTCLGVLSLTWNGDNTVVTLVPDSALSASTLHSLRILASVATSSGETMGTDFSSVFTTGNVADTTPPSTPPAPAATPISSSQIDLTWSAATDDFTPQSSLVYHICRSTTPGGCASFTILSTTGAGVLNYSDTGLSPLTTYYYRIQAQDLASNTGTPTAELSATTAAAGTVNTPTFSPLAGIFGAAQNIAVSTSTGGATICYTTNGTDPTCLMGVCTNGTSYVGSVPIATDTTLKAMACINGFTDSGINTGSYVIDTLPPGGPGGAAATPMSLSQIDVSWTAATDNVSSASAISYEICRSTTPGACGSFTVTATTPPGTTTHSATGLNPLTTYYFRVRAKDEVGNIGPATSEFSATTLSAGSVATPTFLPIAGTYGTAQNVTITSATGGATICYTTNGVDPGCTLGICSGSTTYSAPVPISANTTLKALGCGIGYTNSAVQTGSYIIDMTPPTVPSSPGATANSTTQITVNWMPSSDNTTPTGSIIYEICMSTTPGSCGAFVVSATTGPGATNQVFSSLNPGTTYYFVIRARDQFSNIGAPTTEISATTNMPPQVMSTNPADNAANVAVGFPIIITFNKTINTGTATAQTTSGPCTNSLQVSFDNFATCIGISGISWDGLQQVATLTPANQLLFLTQYKIRVTTAVTDTTSTPLVSQFTTPVGFLTKAADPATLDTTFAAGTGANSDVTSVEIVSGGEVLIAGLFTTFNGLTANKIVKIDSTGVQTGGWSSNGASGGEITCARQRSDGTIFAVGTFTSFDALASGTIARASTNGASEYPAFNPGTGFSFGPNCLAIDSAGSLVVVGGFTSYNASGAPRVARILDDGTIDGSFNPGSGPNNDVSAVLIQPDNKIVLGGNFTSYNGNARNRIVRINTDGSIDTGFSPTSGANNKIFAIARQADGKLILAGTFTTYDGFTANKIVRVLTNGTYDNTFAPSSGALGDIYSVAIQTDGKILIGGNFSQFNGVSRPGFARVNSDGSLDTLFDPLAGPNGTVNAIAIQADNKIIIGGAFTDYGGTPRGGIARIHP